jgi:hypothetical protein
MTVDLGVPPAVKGWWVEIFESGAPNRVASPKPAAMVTDPQKSLVSSFTEHLNHVSDKSTGERSAERLSNLFVNRP